MQKVLFIILLFCITFFSANTFSQNIDFESAMASEQASERFVSVILENHQNGTFLSASELIEDSLRAAGVTPQPLQVCNSGDGEFTCRCDGGCWESSTSCGCFNTGGGGGGIDPIEVGGNN